MRGLFIRSPWIEKILSGEKTWEIRGSNSNIRGTVALLKSGTNTVVGAVDLVDSIGPLSLEELQANADKAGILVESLPYARTHAWVFEGVRVFDRPIPFVPKSGAVIWTNLDDDVAAEIQRRLGE